MTDAAHCDNEATIVPPKDDGAAFPKGESRTFPGKRLFHNEKSDEFGLTRG